MREIEALAKQHADFGFETTPAGREHLNLIRDLKRRGYEVHFFYHWPPGRGVGDIAREGTRIAGRNRYSNWSNTKEI